MALFDAQLLRYLTESLAEMQSGNTIRRVHCFSGHPFVQFCMEITLSTCTLRPWQPGDEPSLVHHANNRNIWKNLRDLFPHPYTFDDAVRWIETGSKRDGTLNFAIVVDGSAVGGIGLVFDDDAVAHTAEIGYWLGEEFWGRGIATEAVRAVTQFGITHCGLDRVYAGVFEWNYASMRVLEKAGYRLESRNRKSVVKDGSVIDEIVYASVRSLP
jgi:ribosomal-protein-alanine N-acetyltransferase